jgi:hypothetical protein
MLRDELVCRVDTKCANNKFLGYIEVILIFNLVEVSEFIYNIRGQT